MATTHSSTTPTIATFYERNALSYLRIAAYWVKHKVWDRAIAALKAAIRSATRADRPDVAGEAFVAIRQCQQRMDAPAGLRETAAAAGQQ
jgi:hypothetical protein